MADTQDRATKKDAKVRSSGAPPWLRGAALLAVGVVTTFLLMANEQQIHRGPLWGTLAMLVAVFGLLDLLGIFRRDAAQADPVALGQTALGQLPDEPAWMTPRYTVPIAIAILVVGGLAEGVKGLPWVFVLSLAALVPSAMRRPGLAAAVIAAGIMLPTLGVYGLWDPWETHYGEVSREILSRDDWVSLWWAQEDWFWSKPIFIFWAEALTMGYLGFNAHPDAHPAAAEWPLRLPVFLVALAAILAVYAAVQRVYGKRAGLVAAIVLATVPHFYLLSHQAITDMHFVGTMTVAMCLLILGLAEDPAREVKSYRAFGFSFSAQSILLFVIGLLAIPQILYLASRNVTMVEGFRFAWHHDHFMFGSAGNGNVPGNKPTHDEAPFLDGFAAQPMGQALFWALGLAALFFLLRKERRARSLYMFGFYVACALSFMAKGIPGFALPGLIALLWLVATRRWSLLWNGELRVAAGALTLLVVGMPWYVAMYFRHGPAFTDRILVHDHLNRLAAGVHGDNGTIEYFVSQLGWALFPWVALLPAAITAFLHAGARKVAQATTAAAEAPQTAAAETAETAPLAATGDADDAPTDLRGSMATLIALWFVSGFVLFSAMVTKFHHYIFPVVPPAAILVGLVVDRMLGPAPDGRPAWRGQLGTVLAALAGVPLVLGIGAFRGNLRGAVPFEVPAPERQDWAAVHGLGAGGAVALVALAVALAALAFFLLRWKQPPAPAAGDATPPPTGDGAATAEKQGALEWGVWGTGLALAAAPMVCAFAGRDLAWVTAQRPGGYERLIDLFVYNYTRPWPDVFDYRPILGGFAVASTICFAVAAVRALRPLATRVLLGVAIFMAVWALDVYLVDLSPHWSQRDVINRYYELRHSAQDPLVAWQMNWKGENYYSGNRVNVFVDLDNTKLNQWIRENAGKHAFFMLEHSRLPGLRSLVAPREVHEITGPRDNNKFLMVQVDL